TAETIGDTQYFKGTVYIYPGQKSLKIDTTNVALITLNGVADTDRVTVTPIDKEAGAFFEKANDKYFLQRGKSFYFTVESGTGDAQQIGYASINSVSANATLTVAMANKAVMTGYAGVNASGTLTMTYSSVTVPFTVSDGAFEITVPAGQAMTLSSKLTQTIGNTEFTYTGSVSLSADQVKDKAVVRFHPASTASADTLTELSGSGYNFAGGRGSFELKIKNTGTAAVTYTVTAGPAWVLDQTYTITVNAGATSPITINGRYDPFRVGAGNPDLNVKVSTINGTVVGTYVIGKGAFPGTVDKVTTPGKTPNQIIVDARTGIGATADAVNSHEYMYAITITNNDNYLKRVTIDASMIGSHPDWSMVYEVKDGGIILPAGSQQFDIKGFGSTVIYVKLMPKTVLASDKEVPKINVNVTTTMSGQTFYSYTNDEGEGGMKVIVDGTHVTFQDMYPQPAKLEVQDASASGTNISNESSGIPGLTLVLLAAAIVMFIAMMWLGIKKGVFVRRR
ncbi:MAG: hypothetical protein FWC44_03095, partial [Methanomassiliicoccaceae archaeon]|nr:hypothetical protein [Methanomassiliicoccaceae archaeon]